MDVFALGGPCVCVSSMMHLPLCFLVFSVPWLCLGQGAEQTGQTRKSEEQQTHHDNSTWNTAHSAGTPTTSARTSSSPSFSQSSTVMEVTTSPSASLPFADFIKLTTEHLSVCLRLQDTLYFNALAGQMTFSDHRYNATGMQSCSVQLVVPPDMVLDLSVSINIHTCFDYGVSLKSDQPVEFSKYMHCNSDPIRLMTPRNNVQFILTRYRINASVEVLFNFTAVASPQLEVVFITSTTGYVQTPGWDGRTDYPNHLDSWARLDVPVNSSVMVSFLALDIESATDCRFDYLTVYIGGNETVNGSLKLIFCNKRSVLKPTVFHTNLLLFHFVSDKSQQFLGFRLYFSFQRRSELPEELNDGKWNCSVPFWPTFQIHFHCNLVEECQGWQDEEHCEYSGDRCDRGFSYIGSSCYRLMSDEKHVTWNEASNQCLLRGAYLAALNRPGEWKEAIDMVRRLTQEDVYFGMQIPGPSFPALYRNRLQWADGSAVYYAKIQRSFSSSPADCSLLRRDFWDISALYMVECNNNLTTFFMCEKDPVQSNVPETMSNEVVLTSLEWQGDGDKYTVCPSGHVTLTFMACDLQSACWASPMDLTPSACEEQFTLPPPSLQCLNGGDHVPYTLVCDHRSDCSDNSDETFCVFPSCQQAGKFHCTNKQCVEESQRCDQILHCVDGSDERQCSLYSWETVDTPEPPAIIHFDGRGFYQVRSFDVASNQSSNSLTSTCPDTHFLCPGNLTYCMPVFVRCNGVSDCPGREDEDGCDRYHCPAFYRCRASTICVHASHLCDGVFHCPQRDDELICQATCPQNCTCQGLAFYCQGQFPADHYPQLRFLHAPGSDLLPEDVAHNSMLIYLNLAQCKLTDFSNVIIPNLRILDLSGNELVSVNTSQMENMNNLIQLSLAGNPLEFYPGTAHSLTLQFPLLQMLDLSNIMLSELNVTALMSLPRLVSLNLSGCGTQRISEEGFRSLRFLSYLDIKSCPMTEFPPNPFEGLLGLKEVWADNYKLCCPATLPKYFAPTSCHSPSDEISSCDALLRSNFYRIILSVFAVLALVGNVGSFVYRVWENRAVSNLGFGVFVTHLCVADFLMGVYLAVIGIADRNFQGNYLWKADVWKGSTGCKVAGFLSLLSNEVSAFIICLITLDRFLVLRFPFSDLRFKKNSAHAACTIIWLIGVVLAGVPLLPVAADWHFYSQTGICIPLPITRKDIAGHDYSFSVMIILNFILFLFIAAGQAFIYWSVRSNSMAVGDTSKMSNDVTIARRLITIAVSDFLCWFPIGLLGLLASRGVPVPGEVNVAIAILILPVNSAINPFLYTLNMLLERRRRGHDLRMQKRLLSTLASQGSSQTAVATLQFSKTDAVSLLRSWLAHSLLSPPVVQKIVSEATDRLKTSQDESK